MVLTHAARRAAEKTIGVACGVSYGVWRMALTSKNECRPRGGGPSYSSVPSRDNNPRGDTYFTRHLTKTEADTS